MNLVITEKIQKPTICLNMIVKNESNIIFNTLNNLCAYINFDYWVISDTGSTDNTMQIIKDYFFEKGIPGELISHTWKDFGYNRTKALECAYNKTDYLFIFDADDIICGDFKLPFSKTEKNNNSDRYMLKIGKGFEYIRPLLINNRKRWMFKGILHEFLFNLEQVNADETVDGSYHIESGRTGNRSQSLTKYYDDAIILQNAYYTEIVLPNKGLSGRYAFYCARSFKDAGEKYYDQAIEWYKNVLNIPQHWHQETYYAALEIGIMYREKKNMDMAVYYLLKTVEYDIERIEGLIIAIEHFYQSTQYILINALYHKFKHYNRHLQNKLFMHTHLYFDRLEFFNGITAHYINDRMSGYICCKQVIINQLMNFNEITITLNNLLCYREILREDKDTLIFFRTVDQLIYNHNELVYNKNVVEIWNLLFNQNRAQLTRLNKCAITNIQNTLLYASKIIPKKKILITFTTCRRLELFKETINSILNHWVDICLITDWFCVDDNSTEQDRLYMKNTYNWIEYYMKTPAEKGHRTSMNIIWNKIKKVNPTYWIHLEDDFLFYHQTNYITQSIELLSSNNHNIKQIVFNRNYAETVEHYNVQGHIQMTNVPIIAHVVLHDYQTDGGIKPYINSHYWPHYSFRPAMVLASTILNLGNFDSPNQFFERDYANKWQAAGYKTAFFDRITHRHIGRLTSEINKGNVKNAYELNNENQFYTITPDIISNIKVVNLERRMDRKANITQLLESVNINNYTFFKAVDGNTIESTNNLKKIFLNNDFGSRKGIIGCALSHLQLWKELMEDNIHEHYIIFEDDITFSTNVKQFKEYWDIVKTELNTKDILFFGYSMFSNQRQEVRHIYDTITAETIIKIKPLNKQLYIGGTFAYSINKVGAKKILNYINLNGIKHGIDYLINIMPDLNRYELQPLLIKSAMYEETNETLVDTDIQTNYERLDFTITLEDQFNFIPNLDQTGYDLYFQPGEIITMMSIALKDNKCVGFNTLGFFKNKTDTLALSQYFKEGDGIYIKKNNTYKNVRLKMLCNWCSSEQLCKEWSNMYKDNNNTSWQNIVMTSTNDPKEIDYYIIINSPPLNEHYVPENTIVFQMEPWVYDPMKKWGVKTWGEWANPDSTVFLKVFTHKTHLNNVQWQVDYPFYNKPVLINTKQNKIAVVCSHKNFDKGQILRNTFIKFIENMHDNIIDIWGHQNYHHFQNYKGNVPEENKYNVYANYKYVLAVENNNEPNYATEKIWESILCESLCFYWGCSNLEDYIDAAAFIRLPLDNMTLALKIIQQAIAENWWTQRIDNIKRMKEKILNKLGFFPLISSLVNR